MTKVSALSAERRCVDRARAALNSQIDERNYATGSRLFQEGELPTAVFFLRSGSVRLERSDMAVHTDLCVARAGAALGVTFAISGRTYDMSAVATTDCRVEVVGREEFIDTMLGSPGLHLEVVRMLSMDLGRCYEVLRTLGPKSRKRVAKEDTL